MLDNLGRHDRPSYRTGSRNSHEGSPTGSAITIGTPSDQPGSAAAFADQATIPARPSVRRVSRVGRCAFGKPRTPYQERDPRPQTIGAGPGAAKLCADGEARGTATRRGLLRGWASGAGARRKSPPAPGADGARGMCRGQRLPILGAQGPRPSEAPYFLARRSTRRSRVLASPAGRLWCASEWCWPIG